MSEPEPTTKGTILRSLLKFVEKDLNAEQRSRAYASLPAEDQPFLNASSVLSSQKVPEFLLNRITEAAAREKGEPLDSFGRRAGRAELADAVGVYRFLTMILTPTALLRKASTLWSTVHSVGALVVDRDEEGAATISLVRFPSERAHCARMSGWFEGAAVITKARNPRILHDLCVTRGDERCRWQLTWSK